ncbi:MAG: hypothetical protein FWF07_01665 [Methanomassiliicoccaceae archaeon]|nr:hypothetical protein [Methanomassiliicoccaceae archaeon]
MAEKMTVGEILGIYSSFDDDRIAIFIGRSVEDAAARSPIKKIGRSVRAVESNTVASDHKILSGEETKPFRSGETVSELLIITIDDSFEKNDPNIKRYMHGGHTYPQAKSLQMYNLGMYGGGRSVISEDDCFRRS